MNTIHTIPTGWRLLTKGELVIDGDCSFGGVSLSHTCPIKAALGERMGRDGLLPGYGAASIITRRPVPVTPDHDKGYLTIHENAMRLRHQRRLLADALRVIILDPVASEWLKTNDRMAFAQAEDALHNACNSTITIP